MTNVARLKPYQYLHIYDNNANVTRVVVGPLTYTLLDHERAVHSEPQNFIVVRPGCYCIVKNPVARDAISGEVLYSHDKQVKVHTGHTEIRFEQAPFALFPGEELETDVTQMEVLTAAQALRLYAIAEFMDDGTVLRKPGDEWLLRGPCTYRPRVEVEVRCKVDALVVEPCTALHLEAICDFAEDGRLRRSGERWMRDLPGAYVPPVEVRILRQVAASILTDRLAIHVEAQVSFVDRFGVPRRAGEAWLITVQQCNVFIPSPDEKVLCEVQLTAVGQYQYCVVENYRDTESVQHFGRRQLREGICSFFLHPGEALLRGVENAHILSASEGLVLRATEAFTDANGTMRMPGERWMIVGPCSFIPPVEAEVVEHRTSIPLDANEGIYIRDRSTGLVRAHIGSTVMLSAFEELWSKPLPPLVAELLELPRLTKRVGSAEKAAIKARGESWRVVICKVPHNAVVQVYDYRAKQARVVLGPQLVALQPDEEFTVLSFSAGKPKTADMLKALAVHLGPDFMTDSVVVETKDHARLQLDLCYSWEFDRSAPESLERVFNVPDFVGNACKAIASRIRGAVAAEGFDQFHRNSTVIIQQAVFGRSEVLEFPSNGLRITSVDIRAVDPVDPKTREALQKSVQLAIEITTMSQEAAARHTAVSKEQAARGELERQVVSDMAAAEEIRKVLHTVVAENAAIESSGASVAQAKAVVESQTIEAQSECDIARLRAKGDLVMLDAEVAVLRQKHEAEAEYRRLAAELEVARQAELARIETEKFRRVVGSTGRKTIVALARAGPRLQSRLLGALGLQGYLITDGTSPINLFNTAKGLATAAGASPSSSSTSGATE